jgi:hypothetical protein
MSKVLAVLATFVVALLGAHVARADADFSDPASDANGAPDVTDVSVFNDAFNRVIFAARITGGKAMECRIAARVVQDRDVAACRLTVPKTAKGKLLKLTLTTTSGGKTVKKSYSTKVRA